MVTNKETMSFTIDIKIKKYWQRVSRKENLNLSGLVNEFLKNKMEKRIKREEGNK
jgi:hypothetical protein